MRGSAKVVKVAQGKARHGSAERKEMRGEAGLGKECQGSAGH